MSFIIVLTKRVIAKKDFNKCKCLLNNLYKDAYNNNGFLGASTYIESQYNIEHDKFTHHNIWTISKWASNYEWNNWQKNNSRLNEIN